MNQDFPIFHRKQVKFLTEFYHSNKERILIITGPRGSGKTSLIKHFLEEIKDQIKNNYIYLSDSNSHTGLNDLILKSTKLLIIDDFEDTNQGWGLNIKMIRSISDRFENLKIIITTEKIPYSLPKQTDFVGRTQHLEIEPLNRAEIDLYYNKVIKKYKIVASDYDKIIQSFLPTIGALNDISELIRTRYKPTIDLINQIQNTFRTLGLIDINGNPLESDSRQVKKITSSIRIVNSSLIDQVVADPSFLYQMSPRQFEELVAELLSKEGFEVNLTKATRDGGKDIFIAHNNRIGDFLYYIECKRYGIDNPIGVNLVRELYGTVSHDRATAGMLVTTSYFSPDALDFVSKIKHQISLKDYIILQDWINSVFKKNKYNA